MVRSGVVILLRLKHRAGCLTDRPLIGLTLTDFLMLKTLQFQSSNTKEACFKDVMLRNKNYSNMQNKCNDVQKTRVAMRERKL